MDSFSKHLVEMVRQLPDEAILELVRSHLEHGNEIGETRMATTSSTPAKKPRAEATRRRRSSTSRAKLKEAVLQAVTNSDGMALSDVAEAVGASKARVQPLLRALKDEGAIHLAGDRRFARYGRTRAIAKAASKGARKG
ncbi:MAG: hypothetical protein KC731_00130 [Myxococcales bacterium]|nr:hypothetical protein [Myxococcales bacterium]